MGYEGGLYPGGSNVIPESYLEEGIAASRTITTLNSTGFPSTSGKIVVVGLGMSNANLEFQGFLNDYDDLPNKNPQVLVVNGGHGGQSLERVRTLESAYWTYVEQDLIEAGVTPDQVQVLWIKEALGTPPGGFPLVAQETQAALQDMIDVATELFPNTKLIFVSSRIYGGYTTKVNRGEPTSYRQGFGFKWLIESRIEGTLSGPWIDWGPYLWADGMNPRSDGLIWRCIDLRPDKIHPAAPGIKKVADLMMSHFSTHPAVKDWLFVSVP